MYNQPYIPMHNGPGTNLLGQVDLKRNDLKVEVDPQTNTATVRNHSLTAYFNNYDDLKSNFSVGAHKLLDVLLIELSQQNENKVKSPDPKVKVPLEDYMVICGMIDRKPSRSEVTSIKTMKDEARKQIRLYLETLSQISIEWSEEEGKRYQASPKMALFKSYTIERGIINVTFTNEFAEYVAGRKGITQYPTALLRLDGRNSTAYYLGKKLAWYYGLKNNVKNHRNDYISVKSLLSTVAVLSDRSDLSHWKRRIRSPFESAMNTLKNKGIISEWSYCPDRKHSGSEKNFSVEDLTFDEFLKDVYISFKIKDFPLPIREQIPESFPEPFEDICCA